MAAPTPTLNPRSNSQLWTCFVLGGIASPGTIARGGVRGFKRETGWDKRRGKGTQGATLTLTTQPPSEGSFLLQLISGWDNLGKPSTDFEDWDAFVAGALAIQPAKQQANGLPIFYPGFTSIGLTAVVVVDYSPPMHVGKGLYIVEIKLCEWQKPPAVSIVQTVAKTAAAKAPDRTPKQQNPEIVALEKEIALLNQANQTQ